MTDAEVRAVKERHDKSDKANFLGGKYYLGDDPKGAAVEAHNDRAALLNHIATTDTAKAILQDAYEENIHLSNENRRLMSEVARLMDLDEAKRCA